MGILDTLKKVKADGFDPTKDRINDSGRLDSGDYPVRIVQVDRTANKGNREQVSVKMEVVSGDFKGRSEVIFLSFDNDLPEFVLDKNAKLLLTLIEYTGLKPKNSDLADEEAIAETLSKAIGKQFKLSIKVVPNKKQPEYPYRNYEISALDGENIFSDIDIEEDDLPF